MHAIIEYLISDPDHFASLFTSQTFQRSQNAFEVTLTDLETLLPKIVTIDSLFPHNPSQNPIISVSNQPALSVWVQAITKAIAKFLGSYNAYDEINVGELFTIVTGR